MEQVFFSASVIWAKVLVWPSGMKMGSQPKPLSPAGEPDIEPLITPVKICSCSWPPRKTRVVWAVAVLSDLEFNSPISPGLPKALEKSLMYGPGSRFRAVKVSETYSTKIGLCYWA